MSGPRRKSPLVPAVSPVTEESDRSARLAPVSEPTEVDGDTAAQLARSSQDESGGAPSGSKRQRPEDGGALSDDVSPTEGERHSLAHLYVDAAPHARRCASPSHIAG